MVHEIGHTLGFRHTNWQSNPCPPYYGASEPIGPGANQISGTPPTDAASVMNACNATGSWNGFSNYDLIAVATLYPGPANLGVFVSSDAPEGTIVDGHFTWTAAATGGAAPYTYYWSRRNFCDADFQPISSGSTYEEDTYYREEPFYLQVTVYSPFKGQAASTIDHVGGFWSCNP